MKYEDIITKVKSYNWKKMSRFMKFLFIICFILALPIIVVLAPFLLTGLAVRYVSVIPRVVMKFKTIRVGCFTVVMWVVGYLVYRYHSEIYFFFLNIDTITITNLTKYGLIVSFVISAFALIFIPIYDLSKSKGIPKEPAFVIWLVPFLIMSISAYLLHILFKIF